MVNKYEDDYNILIELCNNIQLVKQSKQGKAMQSILDYLIFRGNNKIVCLCGSTKFKDDFDRVSEELTLKGYIVLRPEIYSHNENNIDSDNRCIDERNIEILKKVHYQKIYLADEIIVINHNDYIGSDTKDEIIYAMDLNKKISFMEPTDFLKVLQKEDHY